MFTDDTNLFLSDENIGELFQQMNKELKSISTWFKANKLSYNIDKIKWTIFYPTSKKRFVPTKFPELLIIKFFKEKLKAYLFTLDDVIFLFLFCVI